MATAATTSFEIRTAQQYLDELLRPALGDFLKDALSSRKAIACAIFAWHLHEWIWAQHKPEIQKRLGLKTRTEFVCFVIAECPTLQVLQELANGSKHFKTDGSTVAGTELGHGFASGFSLAITQSHLIVRTNTTVHFAENLLNTALSYWASFFVKYLSPPQQTV